MISHFSCVWLFATLSTVACQVPLSMVFPGNNTAVGCHFLLQGSLWPREWTHMSYISCLGRCFFFFFFNLALPLIYLALFRCTQSPRILISKKIKCIWKHDAAINHEWRRKWQPTPVFLPRESPGQRSLVGCSLWGLTELDTIAAT